MHSRPTGEVILTDLRPRCFESEPDFRPIHTKFERLLSKSLTTLEVLAYYLVVHTGLCRMTKSVMVVVVGRLTSQQHATVSQGRICVGKCTCCHLGKKLQIKLATLSTHDMLQYTDTGSPSFTTDPITPGTWARMHHKVVGNFRSEADVRSRYYRR